MRFDKVLLLAVLLSAIVALPIAAVLNGKTEELNIERSQKEVLKIEKKATEEQVQLQIQAIEKKRLESEALKQENEKLKADLQAKLEREEAERVALEAEQSYKTSVAVLVPVQTALSNCESYRPIIAKYQWNVDQAMRVMKAESSCNQNATSRTCDRGLLQINCVHSAKVNGDLNSLYDPETNIRVAYQIYKSGGWCPWVAAKNLGYCN